MPDTAGGEPPVTVATCEPNSAVARALRMGPAVHDSILGQEVRHKCSCQLNLLRVHKRAPTGAGVKALRPGIARALTPYLGAPTPHRRRPKKGQPES
jgi:hypothetical protein